jgi:hypothetical protein
MPRPVRDFTVPETAMRVVIMVQRAQRGNPHFVMRDVMSDVCQALDLSRAHAYRLVRLAIDILGIDYDGDHVRMSARRVRGRSEVHAA